MRNIKILAIIPYEGLRDNMLKAAKSYENVSMQVVVGTMELGLKYAKEAEKAELAITAPISFRLKARKIHEVVENMLRDSQKSITLTGYSVSDYFTEMIDLIILKSQQGVYVRLYLNDYEKHRNNLKRLMDLRTKYLRVFDYQKQDDDAMAALHAKTIVVDEKELLVSSANLSYHGMQGNVEMGIRLVSPDKAQQIEGLLKEMVGMKVFKELRKD